MDLVGWAGGLILYWKNYLKVEVLSKNARGILTRISDKDNLCAWHYANVYGNQIIHLEEEPGRIGWWILIDI